MGGMDGHVYGFSAPKSTEQQAFTQARIAQLTAQRREQRRLSWEGSNEPAPALVARARSNSSTMSPGKARDPSVQSQSGKSLATPSITTSSTTTPATSITSHHARYDSEDNCIMEATRAHFGSQMINRSSHSDINHQALLSQPFELRHGRRYLRDLPYPLPCDVVEIQRQNLRTLLACEVVGRPFCSPNLEHAVPKKVLELGCGSGYWSAMAHDYFSARGHPNVSFTGVDVAPLAADLRRQGVNWRFVQHDLHRQPWPFEDEEFDLIMLRDLSLMMPMSTRGSRQLDEPIRLLREGGTLEIWESDLVLRALLPHSSRGSGAGISPHTTPMSTNVTSTHEQEIAARTATFLMAAGAPFAPAQNRYLVEANAWITEALDRRRFSPMPCARIAQLLIQEPELSSIGMRRVAIPLSELPWERETVQQEARRNDSQVSAVDSPLSTGKPMALGLSSRSSSSSLSSSASSERQSSLTPAQLALRQTALITVLQMIESLEPLLKEASGKNSEEWSNWWASMMTELSDPDKANLSGECLELGVWWATKASDDN